MASDKKMSYDKCDFQGAKIPDRPTFAYVDKWASVYPDKEAYVFRPSETERDPITYSQLKEATENLAIWLKREFGLKRGDRVGILSINRIEYVLSDMALARLGVVSVRIYVSMDSRDDLTRNLKFTDCRLFLCQHASLKSVSALVPLEEHNPKERLVSEVLPKLEHVVCLTGEQSPGTTSWPNWREIEVSDGERSELHQIQSGVSMDDDCSIFSTSGSTGVPKMVVHSHNGVQAFPSGTTLRVGITSDDRYFADRPLAHLGGNANSMLWIGGTMIIANPWKTHAENQCEYLLTVLKEERVNCGLSFPYLLYDIVKSGTASEQFKQIDAKFFILAGQVVNAEILSVVKDGLNAPIFNTYGSTEMGGICAGLPSDPLPIMARYCGRAVHGTEIKITDPKTREILPRGEIGAIAIRRFHKWYYLKNEEKMKQDFDEEGYFYQGDMARMDENGYIEIMGRKDDMMSVGTVKIYPRPVELMICRHPAVDKAIVFGVPDQRMYEVIGAVVLPKQGQTITKEELLKFFDDSVDKNDLMTGSAYVPKHVWIESSFPLTSSGKVDKKKLRENCLKTLGIDV